MNGFTLGQSHAITPQDIGEDFYTIRDDLSVSFNRRGRHDLRIGGEYMYHFTFETVCNQCMGQLDLRGGPVPANIESLIVDVNDVSTWNLAPLSNIARFYQRAIGMDSSPFSRPSGNSGFTEYAPRHVYAVWFQDNWSVSPKLTLNLGLRYDLSIGEFVNWVAFPPLIEADRPNDTNNFGPRVGFRLFIDAENSRPRRIRRLLRRSDRPAGGLHAAQRAADHAADSERRTARLRVEPVQRSGAEP